MRVRDLVVDAADERCEAAPTGQEAGAGPGRGTQEGEAMTTAREIMSDDVRCVQEGQSLQEAAQLMKDMGVGALPVCGEDDRLKGMVTAAT